MLRHLPNALTCANLLVGAWGIVAVFTEKSNLAIYFVLCAGFFDFLDGFAARLLKVTSAIGKELDSLADMVSFGLLPSLFLFVHLRQYGFTIASYLAVGIVVFSALRLAKFNVSESKDAFIGLPTPANALFMTSLVFLGSSFPEYLWSLLILLSCFLLVSPMEMVALKFKNFKLRDNLFRYLLVLGSGLLLLFFRSVGLVMLIPFYFLVSLVANMPLLSSGNHK